MVFCTGENKGFFARTIRVSADRAIPVLFALCLILAVLAPHAPAAERDVFRVLFINSYNRGFAWSDGVERGFRDVLQSSDKNIEISVEYLDSRRFQDGVLLQDFTWYMAHKYSSYAPDVVVASDNAAFDFVISRRDLLFPEVPIVFCGYNNFVPELIEGIENITGVNEQIDIEKGVELALKVHPGTTNLAFITSTGDTTNKRMSEYAEKQVFPKLRERFEVTVFKDATLKEIHDKLVDHPSNTIVFLTGQTSDDQDWRILTPRENGRLVSAVSPFPTYVFWRFHLKTGVIGGHVISGPDQGRAAGELVEKILDGEPAGSIPVVMTAPARNVFDYTVMQRFGVKMGDLPEESIVIDQPKNFWARYRWIAMGSLAFILLETVLIILLVMINKGRKKALADLDEERAMLEVNVEERTRELAEANAQLKKYLDILNEHVIISATDLKGTITYVSEAFSRIAGYEREELIGEPHTIVSPPGTVESPHEGLVDTIRRGENWRGELKMCSKDGKEYWVDVSIDAIRDSDGKLEGYTSIQQDITDKKRVEELSITDRLTQLNNRHKLDEALQAEIQRAERYESELSLILLDVDYFKSVNDTYGHQQGDAVLSRVAELIRTNVREVDIPGRWGGEEFLIICPETGLEGARALAEKLRGAIAENEFPAIGRQTCSFGVAARRSKEKMDAFVSRTDNALYRAKEGGRNRVEAAAV